MYATNDTGAGKMALNHPNTSKVAMTAQAAIAFGLAIMYGTDPNNQVAPFSGVDGKFAGIAEYREFTTVAGSYSTNETVDVVKSGIFWVYVDEAVDMNDPVRIVHTDGTGIISGHFATTAVAGKTALLSNCEFRGSTDGAGLVPVYFSGAEYKLTPDA
jgi:hypothetical protein